MKIVTLHFVLLNDLKRKIEIRHTERRGFGQKRDENCKIYYDFKLLGWPANMLTIKSYSGWTFLKMLFLKILAG